jgi:hypothetical protein
MKYFQKKGSPDPPQKNKKIKNIYIFFLNSPNHKKNTFFQEAQPGKIISTPEPNKNQSPQKNYYY